MRDDSAEASIRVTIAYDRALWRSAMSGWWQSVVPPAPFMQRAIFWALVWFAIGMLALGLASLQVFTAAVDTGVADALRAEGLGATVFTGQGRTGPVQLIYSVVKRRSLPLALGVVNREAPDAFVMVEQPSAIQRGWLFPARRK